MDTKLDRDFIARVYNENMTYRELVKALRERGFKKKGEIARHVSEIAIIPIWKAREIVRFSWDK